jgi:hypothetical protein
VNAIAYSCPLECPFPEPVVVTPWLRRGLFPAGKDQAPPVSSELPAREPRLYGPGFNIHCGRDTPTCY